MNNSWSFWDEIYEKKKRMRLVEFVYSLPQILDLISIVVRQRRFQQAVQSVDDVHLIRRRQPQSRVPSVTLSGWRAPWCPSHIVTASHTSNRRTPVRESARSHISSGIHIAGISSCSRRKAARLGWFCHSSSFPRLQIVSSVLLSIRSCPYPLISAGSRRPRF
jgi:hypothetical protein